MSGTEPLVVWFENCRNDMVEEVGGKCASLGELINAGIRVPPGFAITSAAYRHFMEGNKVLSQVDDILKGIAENDIASLEKASEIIRTEIEKTEFSIELEDQVAEFYRKLSINSYLPAAPVAVRSSATAEDLPDASFAGQQDTFLWVRGVDNVLARTRECISSLFTGRAIGYRMKMGFDHKDVGLCVGVQKMANSFTAGVMFTLNPSNGDRSSIVIDSNWGFGESVVSGEVTPDQFLVNKISMEVIKRTISDKEMLYTVDHVNQKSKKSKVPEERRKIQSVVDEELIELARMGKLIEQHYGRPMDIEWAIDKDMPEGGNIFILQARPETVWADKKIEPISKPGSTAMDHILKTMMTGKKL
ncbi:MAG: phenylphosphate synthase subunit beta [Alphaproteobacteria bacterium]|nr:hypothetical protein [Rhodospirillales bacterium]MCW9046024.1 phenylphosphate synthase subunit beta [Alphaproteobacteria bacterium]